MQAAKTFQDLTVWRKAHQFVLRVYKLTADFPVNERYGLTSQLRRSAVSIPANIVEGFKKNGQADKVRFLNIAQGSLEETRYYMILAKDLNYADTSNHMHDLEEISRLLDAYSKAITLSMARHSDS